MFGIVTYFNLKIKKSINDCAFFLVLKGYNAIFRYFDLDSKSENDFQIN